VRPQRGQWARAHTSSCCPQVQLRDFEPAARVGPDLLSVVLRTVFMVLVLLVPLALSMEPSRSAHMTVKHAE
jgi:hypothetical protein